MWWRIGAALAVTLLVLACLEYLGVSRFLGRTPDDAAAATHGKHRETFWFLIFLIVMGGSVLAAVRRWMGHVVRAVRPKP